jgi:hypothetical protein
VYICRKEDRLRSFIKYTLLWVSQNLSIPFWTVGHIHLMTTIYEDIIELTMSLGMNIIVGVGFYVGWLDHKNEKKNKNGKSNIKRNSC